MKGGGRRDGRAESRPHRCPRGILGANGLDRRAPHCLGCEARGEQVSTGRAAPHARRLHTLKSHDAGTSRIPYNYSPVLFSCVYCYWIHKFYVSLSDSRSRLSQHIYCTVGV